MTTKLRIKAGEIEFEYEGETKISLNEMKELYSHIETLSVAPSGTQPNSLATDGSNKEQATIGMAGPKNQKLHVNSIATKLRAKSAPDVAVAAAVALQIFDEKETFTRKELLDTMKKASMHYKDSMSKNLSLTLKSLVGSKLNQVSDGV